MERRTAGRHGADASGATGRAFSDEDHCAIQHPHPVLTFTAGHALQVTPSGSLEAGNQTPLDQHITMPRGRGYGNVTPLKGVVCRGGSHSLEAAVDVECSER